MSEQSEPHSLIKCTTELVTGALVSTLQSSLFIRNILMLCTGDIDITRIVAMYQASELALQLWRGISRDLQCQLLCSSWPIEYRILSAMFATIEWAAKSRAAG